MALHRLPGQIPTKTWVDEYAFEFLNLHASFNEGGLPTFQVPCSTTKSLDDVAAQIQ
jgi:hypothetical protein